MHKYMSPLEKLHTQEDEVQVDKEWLRLEEEEFIVSKKQEYVNLSSNIRWSFEREINEIIKQQQILSYQEFQTEVKRIQTQYEKWFGKGENKEELSYKKNVIAIGKSFVLRYQKAKENNNKTRKDQIKQDALMFAQTISWNNDSVRMITKKNLAPHSESFINTYTNLDIKNHPEDVITAMETMSMLFEDLLVDAEIAGKLLPEEMYEKPTIAKNHPDLRSILSIDGLGKWLDQVQWSIFLTHTKILNGSINKTFDKMSFEQRIQLNLIIKTINQPDFRKNAQVGNRKANKEIFTQIQETEAEKITEILQNNPALKNTIQELLYKKAKNLSWIDEEIEALIIKLGPNYEEEMKKLNWWLVIESGIKWYAITALVSLLVWLLLWTFWTAQLIKSDSMRGTIVRKTLWIHLRQEQEQNIDSEWEIDIETIQNLLKLQTVEWAVRDMSITSEYWDNITNQNNWFGDKLNEWNKKTIQIKWDVTVNWEYDFKDWWLRLEKTVEDGETMVLIELPPLSYNINAEKTNLNVWYQSNWPIRWMDQAVFGEGWEELNIFNDGQKIAFDQAKEKMEKEWKLKNEAEKSAIELFIALQTMHGIKKENIHIKFNYTDWSEKIINGKNYIWWQSNKINIEKD